MNPCVHCGEPGFDVELAQGDLILGQGALCEVCLAAAQSTLAALRVQFDEMLAAGVPRGAANAIMIARLEGNIPKD